jgi:hypothetical protein
MAAKRKRESSAAEPPNSTTASTQGRPTLNLNPKSNTADHDRDHVNDGNGNVGHRGPKVQYIAAEGSNTWSKSLGTFNACRAISKLITRS